jgi:two-component system LytT family response regulator
MKSLIIDDERLARKELIRLLEPYKEIEIAAEASNVDEALDLIGTLSPELLFLDINMPGKSGFDLLESLDRSPKVIFTTAYDEHAVKAFDYNALDYLMKPIAPERLAEAVKKVLEKTQKEHPSLLGPILTGEDQVFVKDGDNCWFVKLAEVRLFESVGNYVRLYFEEN